MGLMQNLPADIFGGTFDPVQLGHLELIRNGLLSDRVLVVAPTTQNPWKERAANSLSTRSEMLRLALNAENIPFTEDAPELGKVFICLYPYERSVELLKYWRENFGTDLRWLVGPGDKASTESWYRWKEEGCEVIEFSSTYPYHSTDVRNQVVEPHPAIKEYIRDHKLYSA